MPEVNLTLDPINYQNVLSKTWKITGLRVDNNFSSNCLFTESNANLASGYYNQGSYDKYWDATNKDGLKVSSGIYIYKLKSSRKILTRKMAFIK